MSSPRRVSRCDRTELVASYVLATLELTEASSMEEHLVSCAVCRHEYQALIQVSSTLTAWRAEGRLALSPLWPRLATRIASRVRREAAGSPSPGLPTMHSWPKPSWAEVAPGIRCKLLSNDPENDRVCMLVRLAPEVSYPPHRHASVEELYLLEGELWIDDRKLYPGDYSHAEQGTSDQRVWSSTGCMCLLITSPADQLR